MYSTGMFGKQFPQFLNSERTMYYWTYKSILKVNVERQTNIASLAVTHSDDQVVDQPFDLQASCGKDVHCYSNGAVEQREHRPRHKELRRSHDSTIQTSGVG